MKLKKLNIIWLGIVLIVIIGQWSINEFNIVDRLFSGGQDKSGREVAYWVAPMDPNYTSDKPGKSPMGMDLVPVYKDELPGQEGHQHSEEGVAGVDYYYTCGMHPNVHELEPGDCPICGMKLVKKNVSASGAPGQVSIDPVTIQNMGIQSVSVKTMELTRTVRAVGIITYDERLVSSVTTKISGWAEKLYIDFKGQNVKKGDPLIEIYSPELVSTQEEYLQALEYAEQYKKTSFSEAINQSQQLLKSTRRRLELWDISDEQIEELERTKKVKKTMTLYSPINGIVTHKGLNEGDKVMPNMHIYKISDITKVWVNADVYEYELPWLKTGQEATMTLSYLPGREFEGKISFIYPYVEAKTRTVKVRFEFPNRNLELKPDMYANVTLNSVMEKPEIVVPVSAVILSGERSVVILALGEGKFEPREVTPGMQTGDYYSIVRGLHGDEKVVISAQFLIDSESRLREAQMKMFNPKEKESVKSTVTIIGDGEMTHTCPMPEDMVFSDREGKCPECGMNLEEMTIEQKSNMEELLKTHEVEHIHHSEEQEEHSHQDDIKAITLIGEGDLKYACPMPEDMVFSTEPGDCPVCGMHFKEMTEEDHNRFEELKKQYRIKKQK